MALTSSSGKITYQRVASSYALNALLQSFSVLLSNPTSLYLSNASQNLIIYISPTRVVNAVSLQYLVEALVQGERIASAFKSFLETGAATLVFFDARGTVKIFFESCDIRISNPVCFIHPSPEKGANEGL
jgi:uncharacterized NAD-dependent epimerase/dehydratase family protein